MSLNLEASIAVRAALGSDQDCAVAIPVMGPTRRGYLAAVADGAGGTGSGAVASGRLVDFVTKCGSGSTDWFDALLAFDDELSAGRSGGQTTAVVAFVHTDGRIEGASVGDSVAWLISPAGELTDLTVHQRRKPLLGSREALPVVFDANPCGGRLLLATDGLVNYAPVDRIRALAVQGSVAEAAAALADCVRLPAGGLQDDVAVVLVQT
jgi:serine/threonine protein phosphatase PrpC